MKPLPETRPKGEIAGKAYDKFDVSSAKARQKPMLANALAKAAASAAEQGVKTKADRLAQERKLRAEVGGR